MREYRKAKTAMVTKNSAEEEKSPSRKTGSLLMASHAGASNDTWYNLKHTQEDLKGEPHSDSVVSVNTPANQTRIMNEHRLSRVPFT